MKIFHKKTEELSDSVYHVDSQYAVDIKIPSHRSISRGSNMEYIYKKSKRKNRKTGQNDTEVERKIIL